MAAVNSNARNQLQQVMHALHVHSRIVNRSFERLAKHARIVHQFFLQNAGDLKPLRHPVVPDHLVLSRGIECRFERREICGIDDPWLVRQRVQATSSKLADALYLPAIRASEHDDVARMLGKHPLPIIRRGVDMFLPSRGIFFSRVELSNAIQMGVEVRPKGRIHPRVRLYRR